MNMESHLTHVCGITSVLLIFFLLEEGLNQKDKKITKHKLTFQLSDNNYSPYHPGYSKYI